MITTLILVFVGLVFIYRRAERTHRGAAWFAAKTMILALAIGIVFVLCLKYAS